MSTASLHFGPEWMRAKPAHAARPSPALDSVGTGSPALSYASSLVSGPAPHGSGVPGAAAKYSKDELLQIWKDSVVQPDLSGDVERWDGVVSDDVHEPISLSHLDDTEKKLFSQTLNSDLRRRQSQDTLSLAMPGTSPGAAKYAPASPMRDRPFPSLINRRRGDSNAEQPVLPRRLSLSQQAGGVNGPLSPSVASPRPRDGWLARKKTGLDGAHQVTDSDNTADPGQPLSVDSDAEKPIEPAVAPIGSVSASDVPLGAPFGNGLNGHSVLPISAPGPHQRMTVDQLPDPATTQWHYKDPTGNLQGPFAGKQMQEWYGQNYFPGDLAMKRVEFDTEFKLVQDWLLLGGVDFFLRRLPLTSLPEPEPPLPLPVSAIPAQTFSHVTAQASPSPQRNFASVSDAYHHPSRSNTLDAAGTESTGSSYNHSLQNDMNNFGGARGPRFNALERSSLEASPVPGPGYTLNRAWDNNGFQNDELVYAATNLVNAIAPSSPATSLSQPSHGGPQTPGYGAVGGPRYRDAFARGTIGQEPDYMRPLGSSALNQDPIVPIAGDIGIGRPIGQIGSRSRQPSYASERAWANDVSSFNPPIRGHNGMPVDPAIMAAPRPDYGVPRPQPTRGPSQPSAWYYASQSQDDSSWGAVPSVTEPAPAPIAYIQEPAPIQPAPAPIPPPVPVQEVQTRLPTPPPEPVEPVVPAEPAVKRSKAAPAPVPAPAPAPAPVTKPTAPTPPAVSETPSPAFSAAQPVKAAWAKPEEIVPKAKQTLRDIQEAEARQAEAIRKAAAAAAPKERPIVSRAPTEEVTTITTSWGLPTSQAGQAPRASKEPSPQATTAAGGPATAWAATNKPAVATKKSVKQIQEEEEQRKRTNAKDAELIAGAKRAYAQTANKVPVASVWATVGASGKTTAPATPRPVAAAVTPTVRLANGSSPRPTAQPSKPAATKPADESPFIAPSQEFLRWLRESLKELPQGSLEETMKFLLAFPIDPEDATVPEMIADVIYSSSQTLDGRRFANDFLLRRKNDVAVKKGPVVASSAAKQTMVNEIVRTQPKPAPVTTEWKAAGKKKRGKQ